MTANKTDIVVDFCFGAFNAIASSAIKEGCLYFAKDTKELIADVGGSRIGFNGLLIRNTLAEVNAIPNIDKTKLYYVIADNAIYGFSGNSINKVFQSTSDILAEVDSRISIAVSSAMHFKGSLANEAAIKALSNPSQGDMYNALDTGANWAYDGENWDKLSETFDLTVFYTKTESDNKFATKTSLNNYYTKTAADNKFITQNSLNDYYTKTEADDKYLTEHQSLANYYTKGESDSKYLTEHQSLANYYNKTEIDNKFATDVDLSNYYTKTEADSEFISNSTLNSYYTKTESDSRYLTEHQSLTDYYTKAQMENKAEEIAMGMFEDLLEDLNTAAEDL